MGSGGGLDDLTTKPPQRPHHWMNSDGFCHVGDMFEAGTPAMPLYTAEQMEAWVRAERQALVARAEAAEAAVERVRALTDCETLARAMYQNSGLREDLIDTCMVAVAGTIQVALDAT